MAIWRRVAQSPTDEWGPLPPHAEPPRRRVGRGSQSSPGWRRLERLLVLAGVWLLAAWTYATVEAYVYQVRENRELDAILQSAPARAAHASADSAPRLASRRIPAPGAAFGRIEVPRLGISTVMRAGSDAKTLRLAVGHIPGTAWPGERGNMGLAGHRDTFFRRLRDIRPDDEIRVVTPDATLVYKVSRTLVVEPRDVWVLDERSGESLLTLVTCYPFTYIGNAPQRFIVQAELS
jgi:sortase A